MLSVFSLYNKENYNNKINTMSDFSHTPHQKLQMPFLSNNNVTLFKANCLTLAGIKRTPGLEKKPDENKINT